MKTSNLTLNLGEVKVKFNIAQAEKCPDQEVSCHMVEAQDGVSMHKLARFSPSDPLEASLTEPDESYIVKEVEEYVQLLEHSTYLPPKQRKTQPLSPSDSDETDKSEGEPPKVDLKPLPPGLRYEFLGPNDMFPVIINAHLTKPKT